MTDTNAMREAVAQIIEQVEIAPDTSAADLRDFLAAMFRDDRVPLALLDTDRAAGVGEDRTVALLREAMNSPTPTIGQGEYAYAKPTDLPSMLREQCNNVLFSEAEPHVIADAWNIVRMAANELEARLAASPPAPADASGEAQPGRLVRGLQDVREEIERLNERCFGAGSEASVSVRTSDLSEVIDVIRDNLPRNSAAGAA